MFRGRPFLLFLHMHALLLARRTPGAWSWAPPASRPSVPLFFNHHQRLNVLFPTTTACNVKYPCQVEQYQFGYTPTKTAATTRLLSTNGNNIAGGEWKVPAGLHIPEEKLEMSFVRSGGAGGQNVNKLSTQVQIKLSLDETTCDWIPAEVIDRLKEQQHHRINKKNELILHMQEHRTQVQNRKGAVDKLRELILQAWPRPKVRKLRKGVSKQTKERYREEKLMQSKKKESRGKIEF